MNQAIANIIKGHIEGLDFVDKIAGLTSVTYFDVTDKDKNTVQKAFPVACCVTADDCKVGAYNELMPDSKYKTVIYFEDRGVTFARSESNWKYYTSNLRLVCWINVAKLLGDTCNEGTACTVAAHLITDIIRSLPSFPEHNYPFNHVYSEVTNQEIRSNGIFAAYTYDEKHSQYLMYPYDYFALDIQTNFAICMEGTGVYDSDCDADYNTLNAPVATAGSSATISTFTASWEAVDGATGYIIDVATDSGFTSFVVGFINEDVGNVLTYSITGLTQNTAYYYRVRAYNDVTTSDSSNTILITTPSTWFLPSLNELKAMNDNLYLHGVGGFAADAYWSSSEFGAADAYAYLFNFDMSASGNKSTSMRVRACRLLTDVAGTYSLRDAGPSGGLIFYVNGTTFYEASPTDLANSAWSNINGAAIGTTGTAIGTGQSNTTKIIAQAGHTTSAAKLCYNYV